VSGSVAESIARRVVGHLGPGLTVNLGIGIPTLVADHLPAHLEIQLETENGMLGVGPTPPQGQEEPDLVNAGKLPITERPGASYFSSSESFAMIRGGHVDVAVLGALQVDATGHLANWSLPGRPILGVGGAMDLLIGARRVIVASTHLAKDGSPKLVPRCTCPLTGERQVDLVVTDRATFELQDGQLTCTELADGVTLGWLLAHTAADFRVSEALRQA